MPLSSPPTTVARRDGHRGNPDSLLAWATMPRSIPDRRARRGPATPPFIIAFSLRPWPPSLQSLTQKRFIPAYRRSSHRRVTLKVIDPAQLRPVGPMPAPMIRTTRAKTRPEDAPARNGGAPAPKRQPTRRPPPQPRPRSQSVFAFPTNAASGGANPEPAGRSTSGANSARSSGG